MGNKNSGLHRVSHVGKKYGQVTILKEEPDRVIGTFATRYITGQCDCGVIKIFPLYGLTGGKCVSCGCHRRAVSAIGLAARRASGATINIKHGHGVKGKSKTYNSWVNMKRRCTNPNATQWPWYGALGVTICDRWQKFENFLADMGERPEGKTIDRWPDPAGNYESGNCRWADKYEQRNNRRTP